jgi:hypothetical protein
VLRRASQARARWLESRGWLAQEVAVPTPSRPEAQLLVAAVRILEHQHRRPPAIDEIAELLRYSKEFTGHLVRALEPLGIVHTIKSPFEVRVEVRDHLKIETLPAEDRGPGFQDEVDEFHRQFEAKQKKLQNLFESGEAEQRQRQRFANLDDELRQFKNPRADPFGSDPEKSG